MVEDYPRTILELEQRFSTDEACRDYLHLLRWPHGFVCPRCQGRGAWNASRGRLLCRTCRHQTSVTAGTIFQDTRKPLTLWFRAIWLITSQKNGASAASVQQILGLQSYQTAWTWLHKLRRAMVRPNREKLKGVVETDETFVGGEDPKGGAWIEQKALVVIAAEEAYDGLDSLGYAHRQTVLLGHQDKNAASKLLPRVHRIASLLKRWLLGTHQGAVSAEHLDYYLDEFTFRFNRRTSRSRGKLFFRLLQQAVQVEPATYRSMIGGKPES